MAAQREFCSIEDFLEEVEREYHHARVKFPEPDANIPALMEEVGELSKAIMEEPRRRVIREAIQVAAMSARVAIEGDPTLDKYRAMKGADDATG